MSRKKKGRGRVKNRKKKTLAKTPKKLYLKIKQTFYTYPDRLFNYKNLSELLQVKNIHEQHYVQEVLIELYSKRELVLAENSETEFLLNPDRIKYVTGKLDLTKRGSGYVVSEETETDVYIPAKYMRKALNNDTVKVIVKPGSKPEGEVVEIIDRFKKQWVCSLQINKDNIFALPDDPKMPYDFFIRKDKLNGAKEGQKVLVEIDKWPSDAKNPFGKVTDVLGESGDNDTEIHAILAEYGLPYKFPHKVEQEAEDIPEVISSSEIKKRKDLREVTTFTIDPIDAKDFDDALSFQELDNGNIELGVHIADVGHYVVPGSELDKEAYERGNSVYLVDRVVPMLPEKLSNKVCSLRPHEDKLCFSAIFELNSKGKVVNKWFGKTIIHSNHRFTYEEAQEIIEGAEGPLQHEVLTLNKMARVMREQRMKTGSMEITSKEVRFKIAEDGTPLGVYTKVSKEAHQLIEEYMLLANQEVAKYIAIDKHLDKIPFVYRIHDQPNQDKLDKLQQFIKLFGYEIKTGNETLKPSINKLLRDIKGSTEEHVISTMTIRSMAKAIYTTKNIGHFGLGFAYYSHFTSPIRRYADLLVHRQLFNVLEHKPIGLKDDVLEKMCQHISITEKQASDAERSSIKFKQVQFLQDKLGEVFDGVISSITDWGIYVELNENYCEGMVSVKSLPGHYFFDQETFSVKTSHKNDPVYRLGDHVKVQLVGTNIVNKTIDFEMYDEEF